MFQVKSRSIALAAIVALSACATVEPVPSKRPMSAENAAKVGATNLTVLETNDGVQKGWFYTSSQGMASSQGIAGVIAAAIVDAIVNAGPSARARRVANEVASGITAEAINEQMLTEMRGEVRTDGSAGGVSIATVSTVALPDSQINNSVLGRNGAPGLFDGQLLVSTQYLLSEDASTLRVRSLVRYQSVATPWKTPYTFKAAPPKDQLSGPAYLGTFIFYSDPIPAPSLTPEFKEKLVEAVTIAARLADGSMPAAGSKEDRAYQRELERARDETFSKDEIALFLTVEWTKDNGERLRQQIAQAHDFIAKYIVKDVNDPTVPSLTGNDVRVETLAGDRTVRRLGSGDDAGFYVSSSGTTSTFVTFGNTAASSVASRDRNSRLDRARTAAGSTARQGQ
jgi:hypothetical protein